MVRMMTMTVKRIGQRRKRRFMVDEKYSAGDGGSSSFA
jgi:hypothetical protein